MFNIETKNIDEEEHFLSKASKRKQDS